MTFTTQRLVNNRMLVRGSDITGGVGECTLDTTQWDEIKANKAFSEAETEFDEAVEKFFAPLNAAIEKLESVGQVDPDPSTFVVLREEVAGQPAQPGLLVKLNHDSVVLRLLEQGNHQRLVWVDNTLEVLESQPVVQPTLAQPVSGIITTDDVPGFGDNES